MQVKKPYLPIILAALGALAPLAQAAIPYKINYQGRLTRNGNAVNNETHLMSFKIYDAISGGTLIWTSADQTVAVSNGVFSTVLDAGSPAALSTATFAAPRYLELTLDGSTTLAPRETMSASPYAFVAQSLTDGVAVSVSRLTVADGTQGASKVLTSDANGLASWQAPAGGGNVSLASTQTFTGGNTFAGWSVFSGSATFASSVTVSGAVQLSRNLTQAQDAGVTLTAADFGKTITVNSASDQVINLPVVDAAMVGAWFTIVKLNTGKVTIVAGAGSSIADSGVGGTIYDGSSDEAYASITLRLASSTKWVITGGDGSWTTTN